MPMFFPIKQEHVANLKPKGPSSKRYGASSCHPPHRNAHGVAITRIRNTHPPKSGPIGDTQGPQPPLFATRIPAPNPPQTQERERVKTRSLSKTIGYPMIDKDPRMMR